MKPEQKPTTQFPTENPSAFLDESNNAQLTTRLRKQLNDAKSYWNGGSDSKRNLDKDRKRNYQWWLGNHYEGVDLYDHNVPYVNNRVYRSIELSIRIAVARVAYANILPGSDDPAQQQYALDLEKSIQRIAQITKLKKKMQGAARNLLTKYVGLLEPVFDGEKNEINFNLVDPEDVIVSEKSNMFDEPDFYARKRTGTAKQIVRKFPDKEDAIRQKFTLIDDGAYLNDTTKRTYMEVWYDDYDDEDNLVVRCAFFLEENLSQVLGIIENPHWLPEDDPLGRRNFFDAQRKPMIFINYQNSGKNKIDDNAAIDQQIPLNRVLNKRGRQIAENADDASGGIVYNSQMISKEDMALLIGAPDEKIGVNGPVNDAIIRVAPPILPQYVMEDKQDARNQIDEMGATTPTTSNGRSRANTLGEAQLQIQQDFTQQDGLSEAVEDGYLQCYEWAAQLVKVWYTEEKMITIRGEDGKFDYVMLSSDKIEDGIDIAIVTGSAGPLNKEKNQQAVDKWSEQGIVDPLTVFEVYQSGELPAPSRMVERLIKWKTDPNSYGGVAAQEEFDRNAQVDIELLKRGVDPDPRAEITPEYLDTIIKFMTSGPFMMLPQEIQLKFQASLQSSTEMAARLLQMREGLRTQATEILAPNTPIVIDPSKTDPNIAPPPGPPPSDMVPSLQASGAIDAQGRPVGVDGAPVSPTAGTPQVVPPAQPAQAPQPVQ